MRLRTRSLVSLAVAALAVAPAAAATGLMDTGDDLVPHDDARAVVHGALRVRGEALGNLDLDRGPLENGVPLFPVPLADRKGQWLLGGDLRLRTDLAFYAPGGRTAVKVRVDLLDDVPLGDRPVGVPAAATSVITSGDRVLRVKRAWGETATPVGLLAAGRMGNAWGTGMLANGGDCADCDSGDAADRIAFVSPIFGHVAALAYDFSVAGPTALRRDGVRSVALEPSAAVKSLTFAFLHWTDEPTRKRRTTFGRNVFDYGAYASWRTQARDVPSTYVPFANTPPMSALQVVARGWEALALDGWLRHEGKHHRLELEVAHLRASIEDASLLPGVSLAKPVQSAQTGFVFDGSLRTEDDLHALDLQLGYASSDASPLFASGTTLKIPAADGSTQTIPVPENDRLDRFSMHPDFRVDRILFRELLGRVSGAAYVRPAVRGTLAGNHTGRLVASLAAIASMATNAASTPSGKSFLGFEVDPTLAWQGTDGFTLSLEGAAFFPGEALGNPTAKLEAKPAGLARVRLSYAF
jgi:uncharacterized protein (TIGR04551 family)